MNKLSEKKLIQELVTGSTHAHTHMHTHMHTQHMHTQHTHTHTRARAATHFSKTGCINGHGAVPLTVVGVVLVDQTARETHTILISVVLIKPKVGGGGGGGGRRVSTFQGKVFSSRAGQNNRWDIHKMSTLLRCVHQVGFHCLWCHGNHDTE